ncbi:hypothetical protein AWC38_SpisGene13544 [Stylophora pistillata]|uniref:Uncharacterized protein n=1 Tax=Stylophora pistillata TaxID=50429 RepID=A0A2B4RU35_STYPI|nr:hypothetical protein AWC38_SpisGene13544 [Stylophora pistillata]
MPLMYACVKELRNLYGNELEIQINYEDRPENDYNSIFYFLQGKEKAYDSNCYLIARLSSYLRSEVQSERNMFTRQAEKDWVQFLLMRAKELAKAGGRLAVILTCEIGEIETGLSGFVIYKLLYNVWESMEKDRIISKKDMEEMTFPEYFQTREELVEPFISDASLVRKAGLNLISMELKEFSLPEKAMWQATGNAKACARLMTEQTRA